jgi:hypothetical protein
MKTPTFQATEAERAILRKISDRAAELSIEFEIPYPTLELEMDLLAAREDIVTLDLRRLLDSPIADFSHDIFGIRRFINRTTGEVEGCFVPRCAR